MHCVIFGPNRHGCLSTRSFGYLDRKRPLKELYASIKLYHLGGWIVSLANRDDVLRESQEELVVFEDDITLPDGTSIFLHSRDEFLDMCIKHCQAVGSIPAGVEGSDYHVIQMSELPDDASDDFFEAWEWNNGVKVNMPKARGIHMDRIRRVRNAELAVKDITFMRAIEAGDTSAQVTIATQKQVLRDIPQTFDLTTDTPEELKEKWPEGLPKE